MGFFDSLFGGGGSETIITTETDNKSDVISTVESVNSIDSDIDVSPEINVDSNVQAYGGEGGSSVSDAVSQLIINSPLISDSVPKEIIDIEKEKVGIQQSRLQFEKSQTTMLNDSANSITNLFESTTNKIIVAGIFISVIITLRRK